MNRLDKKKVSFLICFIFGLFLAFIIIQYNSIKFDFSNVKTIEVGNDYNVGATFFNRDVSSQVEKSGSINNHFKKLLELVIAITEDGDNPEGLMLCLDEISKFRSEINNKYNKFLEKKDKELALKKLEIIEKELKDKLVIYQLQYDEIEEEKVEERHRSK